jgi:hypothetical protein
MFRFHHMITVPKTAKYPPNVVVLDVDIRRERSADNPNIEIATMTRWHASGFSVRVGECGPSHCEEGDGPESWWQCIGHRLKKSGNIWLFAQNVTQAMSLLGLWDLIEEGEWRLCGADYRDRTSKPESDLSAVWRRGEHCVPGTPGGAGTDVQEAPSQPKREVASRTAAGKARRGSAVGLCVLEDPPVILDVRPVDLQRKLRILDIRNYGVAPASDTIPARERVARWDRFVRDMIGTCRTHKLGGLQCTAGSQSMTAWRYGYYTHPVECHTHDGVLAMEEVAYVGGRCEAYRLGSLPGPIWHLDVSAMYPSVYRTERVPVSLARIESGERALRASLGNEDESCCAEVGIETNEPCYPLRDRRLKLTVWPIGEFTTTLFAPELRDAYERGRVRRVGRVVVYRSANALRMYADAAERLRGLSGISPEARAWCKSLAVCLVGKFGQRDRRWVSAQWPAWCEPWQSWWASDGLGGTHRWRSVAWHTQYEHVGGFGFDAVPAIAGTITSAARMKLLGMIRAAHWGDVYYVDTDSLFVSGAGLRRLRLGGFVQPGVVGSLRIVEEGRRVNLYGIKQYTWDGREVSAGQAVAVDCYTSGGARVWQSARVGEACRSMRAPDAHRVSIPFERRAIYRHGRRMADGTVEPLVYHEDKT